MESAKPTEPNERKQSLRDLFPELSEEQLKPIEDTFYGYVEIAWKIYERLEREQPELFDTLKGSH